jgi:hypothetical protein
MDRMFGTRRAMPWAAGLAAVAVITMATSACSKGSANAQGSSPPAVTTPAMPTTGGASTQGGSPSGSPRQSPVPPEKNPPGDIPDNTVFVPYTSRAGGFTIKVPEGWARTTASSSVSFAAALNLITAEWKQASAAPTVSSARSADVPALQRSEPAFRLQSVKAVTLPGGPGVLITFQENSAPNQVTGKQYRLVVERFELFKNGTEADLTLSSPVGADNVDPWRVVSESFRWA